MELREFQLTVDGLQATCWEAGTGVPLLLLHGSGPGAASIGTWRYIANDLSKHYRILMTDLFGFGQSDKKKSGNFFDIDLWMKQVRALLDYAKSDRVYIVGHSISGYLSLRLASESPVVSALVTTGTMGASFECNIHTKKCWTFPETKEALSDTLKSLMYDNCLITDQILEYRMSILNDGIYGPYFCQMFAGDKQQYIEQVILSDEEIKKITCPTLMIHGKNDLMFPAEPLTLALASQIPQADVLLLSECGHLPATEQPQKTLDSIITFFNNIR